MLRNLLTNEMIDLNLSCNTWKDAIEKGCQILIDRGFVEENYKKAIFKSFEDNGPYMVLAPRIVFAHARPEDGVNKLCMSLITLKEEIEFGHETNDPVKLVLTFGAVYNKSHLKALSQLMELFMNTEDMETIMNAEDKEEVLNILKRY